MYDFDGIQRGGEPIRRTEVEVKVGKLKKDEVTEEMVNGGVNIVMDWIWRLCNMDFTQNSDNIL